MNGTDLGPDLNKLFKNFIRQLGECEHWMFDGIKKYC